MNTDEKSLNRVADLLKQKYKPELYEQEQKEKAESLKDTLSFIDGVLAAYNQRKQEEAEQEEIRKSNVLFVTDHLHPRGWRRNN